MIRMEFKIGAGLEFQAYLVAAFPDSCLLGTVFFPEGSTVCADSPFSLGSIAALGRSLVL